MITLVILNWRRPRNVEHVVARYRRYGVISEIIVVCNAGLPLEFPEGPKPPTVVKSNADLGLYSRFALAALARNDCVLHVDDDLLIPEGTIKELHGHWRQAPDRCYGLHGRSGRGDYDLHNVYGEVEVILTRCLMTSRANSCRALAHVHAVDDSTAVPRGNGEDIILSFTAMMYSGRRNLALRLPCTELDEEGERGAPATSIHRRWNGHVAHRSAILRRCRDYFGLPEAWSPRHLFRPSVKSTLRRSAYKLAEHLQPRLAAPTSAAPALP